MKVLAITTVFPFMIIDEDVGFKVIFGSNIFCSIPFNIVDSVTYRFLDTTSPFYRFFIVPESLRCLYCNKGSQFRSNRLWALLLVGVTVWLLKGSDFVSGEIWERKRFPRNRWLWQHRRFTSSNRNSSKGFMFPWYKLTIPGAAPAAPCNSSTGIASQCIIPAGNLQQYILPTGIVSTMHNTYRNFIGIHPFHKTHEVLHDRLLSRLTRRPFKDPIAKDLIHIVRKANQNFQNRQAWPPSATVGGIYFWLH